MQKGGRLFNELTVAEKKDNKNGLKTGRNDKLIMLRNEALFYRYYYYAKIHQLKYSQVVEKLSNEFYISERTILDITQKHTDLIRNIFSQKPELKALNKKYDFLNWIKKQ
jgi:hypothetical protein